MTGFEVFAGVVLRAFVLTQLIGLRSILILILAYAGVVLWLLKMNNEVIIAPAMGTGGLFLLCRRRSRAWVDLAHEATQKTWSRGLM